MATGTQLVQLEEELSMWTESKRAEQRAAIIAESEASQETAEREELAPERAKDAAERAKELLLVKIPLQEDGTSQPIVPAGEEVVGTPLAINPQ